jgi:hypothetical protein
MVDADISPSGVLSRNKSINPSGSYTALVLSPLKIGIVFGIKISPNTSSFYSHIPFYRILA